MSTISGGDFWGFVDGFCVGFQIVAVATGGAAVLNPVGGTVEVACIARGLYVLATT